jgi:hypothetical protein
LDARPVRARRQCPVCGFRPGRPGDALQGNCCASATLLRECPDKSGQGFNTSAEKSNVMRRFG